VLKDFIQSAMQFSSICSKTVMKLKPHTDNIIAAYKTSTRVSIRDRHRRFLNFSLIQYVVVNVMSAVCDAYVL
jgi:hypothetical protein